MCTLQMGSTCAAQFAVARLMKYFTVVARIHAVLFQESSEVCPEPEFREAEVIDHQRTYPY